MNTLTNHLRKRRSALSMTLESPGPSDEQLASMLEIAARVPDHGKLAPWRFELWQPAARARMHGELIELLEHNPNRPDVEKLRKGTDKILHAPCVVAVISTASDHPKIPEWEQVLSAGAVCMNLLHSANAQGFEAQWLTAWYIYEDAANGILQLNEDEKIAGIVHIGSSSTPKSERPRPNLDDIFTTKAE